MRDAKRFKLHFGPYRTPRFRCGMKVHCEWRGKVQREVRGALRIDGEQVGSVDIRCAQPALLGYLIYLNSPSCGVKQRSTYKHARSAAPLLSLPSLPVLSLPSPAADLALFCSAVVDGSLYELLAEETELGVAAVKKRCLVDVLAKRGRYPSSVEDAFQRLFPAVYGMVRAIKRKNHGTLIRLLQRLEAWLVIEQVAPRLLGRVRFGVRGGLLTRTNHAAFESFEDDAANPP